MSFDLSCRDMESPTDDRSKHRYSYSPPTSTSAEFHNERMSQLFEIPDEIGHLPMTLLSFTKDEGVAQRPIYNTTFAVGWDGPADPECPLNWPSWKKWINISLISFIVFIPSLAASINAPAIPAILSELHSDSSLLGAFAVSVYVLGYAIGPILLAPLSEVYGRLPVYHSANVIFLIFVSAGALAPNLSFLIVTRFLSGCVGAAPLAIGGGTIADLIPPEKRGRVLSIYSLGPLMGPVLGPFGAGYLTQYLGWRWSFWIIVIMGAPTTILGILFLRETHAKTLLGRKAARLRKIHNSDQYISILSDPHPTSTLVLNALARPIKILFCSPVVLLLSTNLAVAYGITLILITTFSDVFGTQYHFNSGLVGLTYCGLGIGFLVGLTMFALFSDKISSSRATKSDGAMKPEYRLQFMVWSSLVMPIGLFGYGWAVQRNAMFVIPIAATSFVGIGLLLVMLPLQMYLIDAYGEYAASALAASTVFRCILGAVLPLFGQYLYNALGYGWGNSVLGFIGVALAPVPWLVMNKGEYLRKRYILKF